ncbi:EpsG family protein [Sulfitobacter sp. JB4-11]|uniref:EpsG family protein n=1 Tax=Sulfitobacter rhodophyticola TaxID=3238304 RepID=UPI0035191698
MLYVGLANLLFILRLAVVDRLRLSRQIWPPLLFGLFLFSAFRWQVGCDWSGYYNQYLLAGQRGWDVILSGNEIIWWSILKSLHVLGLPYPWANVFSSAVFFAGIATLARRQPDPLAFVVLLFPILIVNMPMSGIRQGAAIGLFCIALCAFMDRRMLHFVFWIILGAGFHTSVLLFLLITPLASGTFNRNRIAVAVLLALPGAYLLATGDAASEATARYIVGSREAFGAAFRVALVLLTGALYVLALRRAWGHQFPKDYHLVTMGALAMLAIGLLLPLSTIIADRLTYYLVPVQTMIFARLPFLQTGRLRQFYTIGPYIALALLFTVWTLLSSHFQNCYLPYNSWLFGFPDNAILRF